MTEEKAGLTPAELVEFAAEHGYTDVSERMLIDWRQARLMPPLQQVGRGRGKGADYISPPGSEGQLLALLEARARNPRDKDEWVWELWVRGYDVTELARKVLLEKLDEVEQTVLTRSHLYEEDLEEFERSAAGYRRDVGRYVRPVEPQRRGYVEKIILDIVRGEFDESDILDDRDAGPLVAGFLSLCRKFGVLEVFQLHDEDLNVDKEEIIKIANQFSQDLNLEKLRSRLANLPAEELVENRDRARGFYGLINLDEDVLPATTFALFFVLDQIENMDEVMEMLRGIPEFERFATMIEAIAVTGKFPYPMPRT